MNYMEFYFYKFIKKLKFLLINKLNETLKYLFLIKFKNTEIENLRHCRRLV